MSSIYETHWQANCDRIWDHIQGVSGGIVNILGCSSMGYSE
jgi:hypothetical protein